MRTCCRRQLFSTASEVRAAGGLADTVALNQPSGPENWIGLS